MRISTPISVTGTSTIRRRFRLAPSIQRGFTLLELLVVVAIIGVFLGVATLSTDIVSFDRKVEREAGRLGTLIRFASEEALMLSHDYGMQFYENGYQFFIYDHAELAWQALDADDVLARRILDADMVFELSIEDRDVKLEPYTEIALSDEENDEGVNLPAPQVVIFSSGEVTPFELEFVRKSAFDEPGVLLTVGFDGKTEVGRSEF